MEMEQSPSLWLLGTAGTGVLMSCSPMNTLYSQYHHSCVSGVGLLPQLHMGLFYWGLWQPYFCGSLHRSHCFLEDHLRYGGNKPVSNSLNRSYWDNAMEIIEMLSAAIQAAPAELARQLQWPERHWIPHLIPFQSVTCCVIGDQFWIFTFYGLEQIFANNLVGFFFFFISFQFSPSFCVVSYTCIHFKYQRNVKTLF